MDSINNKLNNKFAAAKEAEVKAKEQEKADAAAKAEADKKAAEREKLLKGVKEVKIPGVMKDVVAKDISTPKNEDGSKGYGVAGNGYMVRHVRIDGIPCMIFGRTEAELKQDYEAAVKARKHLGDDMMRNVRVAEDLVDAGYKPTDIEQVESHGETFVISYKEKTARDLNGNAVATLDNIKSKLDKEDIKTLLIEKLDARPIEEPSCDDECDDCDDCDDDCDGDYTAYAVKCYDSDEVLGEFDNSYDAVDCARTGLDDYKHTYVENSNGDVIWDSDEDD